MRSKPRFRLESKLLVLIFCAAFILNAFILNACNLPATQIILPPPSFPTVQPSSPPTIVIPTAITPQPTATLIEPATLNPTLPIPTTAAAPTVLAPTAIPPTSLPPSALPPSPVPALPASIPGAIRISFETGATEGMYEGQIQPGQVINFVVGASQGQPLMVTTDCLNHDVSFAVLGLKNGEVLLDSSLKLSSWQAILGATQDYLIQVIGGTSTENFSLNITTPARINFDPGAISALRQGSTPGGFAVSYILRASLNQQMDINLNAPNGNAVLSIYGYQDGQPYMRSVVESTVFSLKLPATQDYMIQVVPLAGQVAPYSMIVTVK